MSPAVVRVRLQGLQAALTVQATPWLRMRASRNLRHTPYRSAESFSNML
jgi:hypothetical protein